MAHSEDEDQLASGGGPTDADRRRALVRMGKFAGLTTPAVVTLLTADASEVWAQSMPGVGKPGKPGKPVKPKPPVRPKPPRRP